MDGQKILPAIRTNSINIVAVAAMSFLAAVTLSPRHAFGQAMGQAALDAPAPAAAATAGATSNPRATPAAMSPAEATKITPPSPAELKLTSTIAEAKPLPSSLPEPPPLKPEATPKPQPEKIVDSMPPDAIKPAVLPIEHKAIRPATVENASGETKTSPAEKPLLSSGVINALQVAAALGVVLGLVFIGKALAKKFLPGAKAGTGKGVIEILARYPLCKNQSLVLVRIGSQIVTLNQGKEQSQSVLVINDAEEVARILGQIEGTSPKSIQAGFTKLLANARMDLSDPANNSQADDFESRSMEPENLDTQLEEMASAKRQLMELRQQVRTVRDSLPR